MHRLIMTSDVYMRSTAGDAGNAGIDAQNRYLWRMNRNRLDAETLRDSVLSVAGTLNLKMGGKPVIPPLTKEEASSLWARNQWPETMDDREHTRRSVYLYVKRNFPLPMLSTFDTPDTSVSCARREATTVAPQALMMFNSEFMQAQAARFAERVEKLTGADETRAIGEAFRQALGRAPSEQERRQAAEFFAGQPKGEGLRRLALVLFNTNEFVYVD